MSKDGSDNFIALYRRMQGQSEIPAEYHFWSCIALIGAVLSDRVYVVWATRRLAPNLYVFLIGPSGSGKDYAIESALSLVHPLNIVRIYNGRTTAPHLVDMIGTADYEPPDPEKAKIWLTMPELSLSLGTGDQADSMVRLLTGIYGTGPGNEVPFSEGTRTRGQKIITNPCVNVLAGSTAEWHTDSISTAAVQGGFYARAFVVQGDYKLDDPMRQWEPVLPSDYEEIRARLRSRLIAMSKIKGEMRLTTKALAKAVKWYHNRKLPTYPVIPWWQRMRAHALKLSIIFAVADGETKVIKEKHVSVAIKVVSSLEEQMPEVIRFASSGVESRLVNRIYDIIKRYRQISRTDLIRNVSSSGVTAAKLNVVIETLVEAGDIEEVSTSRGGAIYRWLGGKERE